MFFFCSEVGNKKEMRKAATFGLDKQLKECADLFCDKHILTKLAAVDMITLGAVYHRA